MDTPFNLAVDGMHCGACVRRVKQALEKVDGVTLEDVAVGSARGTFDPVATDAGALCDAVKAAGYEARPLPPGGGAP